MAENNDNPLAMQKEQNAIKTETFLVLPLPGRGGRR
jgi:hypothetical protein